MGIIDRISTLARANVNDLLDRAEDPEKMLNQILRDMETNIRQAREQVASMIAQEKELEVTRGTTKLSERMGRKSTPRRAAGKDDLAREALRRKKDNDDNSAVYQQQADAQKHDR